MVGGMLPSTRYFQSTEDLTDPSYTEVPSMLVKLLEDSGNRATYGVRSAPVVSTDTREVCDRSGMAGGPDLVTLEVVGDDGRVASVQVSALVNARGQVRFTMSTGRANRSSRSNCTATWLKR